jgi:hypothetical protein
MEIICQSQCRNTTHPLLKSRHTSCNRISCASVHCRSDGNHLSVTMSKHTSLLKSPTYMLQSNQLRQACIVVRMEIICQSQCRNKTHSLLKSPTYMLQSNQLRQACIVVRMEIICQSQCRTTHPILKSPTYVLQSNQLRQACIVVQWKSFVSHNVETQHTLF